MGIAFHSAHAQQQAQNTPALPSSEAAFYPYGGAQELTIVTISSAKQSIFLAAEKLTSGPILQALADARKRGVNVLAVLDKSDEKGRTSGATLLAKEGLQIHIDHKHAVHSNYIITDGETLLIGSFGYTQEAAKKSVDNVIVVKIDPAIVKTYRANWQEHWDHSDPFK